jgi:phosphoribosyl 1,2-cyclic phosphodiesterase
VLRLRNLGSGSTGNATLVEGGSGARTTRLLIDCGLTLKELDARLARAGLRASQIDAVFVTHEHGDHIGCARGLARRERKPVWMSEGTYAGIGQPDFDGLLRTAQDSSPIDLGELQVTPFTVPHDAREPLQLTCTDGARKLGVLTDLGHATPHVLAHLALCHALMLEFNHDPGLLARSRYPDVLKRRVGGRHGHLSNQQAGEIVQAVAHEQLAHVVAAHLSLQNNLPQLARDAMAQALGLWAPAVTVADAVLGTDWLTV